MSIRKVNKDQLKSHASVELLTSKLVPPAHDDPLKFWTQNTTFNTLVDLNIFSVGEQKKANPRATWNGPFTGRPKLIHQLAPAIQTVMYGSANSSIQNYYSSLRIWWRLFDAVEQAASQAGQVMDRVEDVRQITKVHLSFFTAIKMDSGRFYPFIRFANLTLRKLNSPELYWNPPEVNETKRHLPPDDQIKALRIALKQEWEIVRKQWANLDRIKSNNFEPQSNEEYSLLKHWQHFTKIQKLSGKILPTYNELRNGMENNEFVAATNLTVTEIKNVTFPGRWEAETAFHLCLANTGWNPAVLYSLDVSDGYHNFLRDHPRDSTRFILTGTKIRAKGKEQPVSGLWKTTAGPGYIIKSWLERISPLREQLKTLLSTELTRYSQMSQDGALPVDLTIQLLKVQQLQDGCRNVWLFVNQFFEIEWLNPNSSRNFNMNGKRSSYLHVLIGRANCKRTSNNEAPISAVRSSDFRDMFALYVWRMTGGNILAVMRVLNHTYLRTTQAYTDNNILNAERDHQARIFIDNLFRELDIGRIDLTILAYLQRQGSISEEQEIYLKKFRTLQQSRIGVGCRDPLHPPKAMQPESSITKICSAQRCLICKSHSIILPESMSGIAMRVEELLAMQAVLPITIWIESKFAEELQNGLDVLSLFPKDAVLIARDNWANAIRNNLHHIPGIHLSGSKKEAI